MAQQRGKDEWVPVIPPPYVAARNRHARFRADAYWITSEEVTRLGVCGPDLRIADIDADALLAWEQTWTGVHPSGRGKWDWRALVENLPRRAAVLPIAIWYGTDLCGLAAGQASRRRLIGDRHTVTLTHIERRPEPPPVPLRGQIVSLATAAAENYGIMIGARRLCLRAPDPNLLSHYRRYGFVTVWKGSLPLHCEREVRTWRLTRRP